VVFATHSALREAIAAGVTDRVLPLADIRDAILRFCSGSAEPAAPRNDALPQVLGVLHARIGPDIRGYRPDVLLPHIRRRMRLTGREDQAAYLVHQREHPEEGAALASDLLDTRVGFFADRAADERLARTVIRPWRRRGRAATRSGRSAGSGCGSRPK